MNILTAPPDLSLPAPAGQSFGPRTDLAKPSLPASLERFPLLGYPSPPMSDSPSPTRRLEQTAGPTQSDRTGTLASLPTTLPPPPAVPRTSAAEHPIDVRRPLLPQYQQQYQQLQQPQYPPHPPHATHPYPPPPSGSFTYHQHPSAPTHAPAYYHGAPPAGSYHPGYPGEYASGPPYGGGSIGAVQLSPTAEQKNGKTARRTKAHVASACVNCKKAHLSCDAKRPCTRCVASNKQDSCYDVPHKKRGRPRLKEDRPAPSEGQSEARMGEGHGGAVGPTVQTWPITRHRRHNSLRALKSHQSEDRDRPLEQYPRSYIPPPAIDPNLSARISMPTGTDIHRETCPIAFLNIDLLIMKSNQTFQDLFGLRGDVSGQGVGDLMEPAQHDMLQRLRNELRDEREAREPAYMPPISRGGEQEVLENVPLEHAESLSQPYQDRRYTWTFRLRNGQMQPLGVNVRLAKATVFFVALTVQPFQLPGPSPLMHAVGLPPAPGMPIPPRSSPRTAPATHSRDAPYYDPTRPSTATRSGPPSPYSFHSASTNLPPGTPRGNAYLASPTTRPGSGYRHSYHAPSSNPLGPPLTSMPLSSSSRPPSATSEPSQHRMVRPVRPESLQLPPLRGAQVPNPLISPQFSDPGTISSERIRPREIAFPPHESTPEPPPDSAKRRRLNIHEVLD